MCAAAAGMPCAIRPLDMDEGSLLDSPATISEKKMPIDKTKAVFMNVAIMPAAAPRWLAGTAFIISARFGAANTPEPNPLSTTISANTQYGKFTGRNSRRTKLSAVISAPPVVNALAPNRSDSTPDSGADTRKPAVSGSR